MNLLLYLLVASILLGFSLWLLRLVARWPSVGGVCALIVSLGLVYDNTVIALGRLIGAGEFLLALSWPRYVIHAFATPLLIIFAWDAARRAGLGWARTGTWRGIAWLLALLMIACGVFFELSGTRLEFAIEGGVASYSSAGSTPFPVPPAVTVLALMAAGIALWMARGWWMLAVATLLSIAGFGFAPALDLAVSGQIAEVVLIAGIVETESRIQTRRPPGSDGGARTKARSASEA